MRNIIRAIFSGICAGLVAFAIVDFKKTGILSANGDNSFFYQYSEMIAFGVMFVIVYFTIGYIIAGKITPKIERALVKYPLQDILMYIIGLSIGLGMANLGGAPLMQTSEATLNLIWSLLLYIGLGYFGVYIVHIKKEEVRGWLSKKNVEIDYAQPKILDTSVIIDGRILDIVKTQFIEGKIMIPVFVLDELRHIADSSDKLRRSRGRRGLDLLKEIQNLKQVPVEIIQKDYPDIEEVDMKLLRLAEDIHGVVVTNDFNLNKVAQLQKVSVLNINDLANAIKPIVLPNEEMTVMIIKEGKEHEQGIAYLNDGTMIVVEQGKRHVGEVKQVSVTSVLQTSAGRMIFAKIIG